MTLARYDARASLENALAKTKERFNAARQADENMPMYLDLYKGGRPYMTICAMPDPEGSVRRTITMISSILNPDAESRAHDSYAVEGSLDEGKRDIAQIKSGLSLYERFQKGDPRVSEALAVTFSTAHGASESVKVNYVRGHGAKTLFRPAFYLEDGTMTGKIAREIDTTLGGVERNEDASHQPSTLILTLPGMKRGGMHVVPDGFIMVLHDHQDWAQAGDFDEWRRFDGGWIGQDSIWDDSLMIAPEPVLKTINTNGAS